MTVEKTADAADQSAVQTRFLGLSSELKKRVVAQDELIEYLLIALLTDGHVLLEGPPGLAKTRTVHALSDLLEGEFHRAQFTPDLLPSDITGTEIYNTQKSEFTFRPGPLFCICYWPMRLTVPRQKYSRLCWKPWQSARLQWRGKPIH